MSKTERLACLYLLFLSRPAGVSFRKIKELMPLAYSSSDDETNRRKFERDKKDLEKLGLQLVHQSRGQATYSGEFSDDHIYIPADRITSMRPLHLTGDEVTYLAGMLLAAMNDTESYGNDKKAILKSIYLKLFYDLELPEFSEKKQVDLFSRNTKNNDQTENYRKIHAAISRKNPIEFHYTGDNDKDPFRLLYCRGLLSYRGRWAVVGQQKGFEDHRIYYLDRMKNIEIKSNMTSKPAPGFQLKDYSLHPLAVKIHEEKTIQCEVSEEGIFIFRAFLSGYPEKFIQREQNVFTLKVTNQDSLFNWMFTHPGMVIALAPQDIRTQFEIYLESIRSLYASK